MRAKRINRDSEIRYKNAITDLQLLLSNQEWVEIGSKEFCVCHNVSVAFLPSLVGAGIIKRKGFGGRAFTYSRTEKLIHLSPEVAIKLVSANRRLSDRGPTSNISYTSPPLSTSANAIDNPSESKHNTKPIYATIPLRENGQKGKIEMYDSEDAAFEKAKLLLHGQEEESVYVAKVLIHLKREIIINRY